MSKVAQGVMALVMQGKPLQRLAPVKNADAVSAAG